MTALFLKRLALHTIRTETSCLRCSGEHVVRRTAPARLSIIASTPRLSCLVQAKAFCTVEGRQDERKKKRKSETVFSNVGRKISERVIRVLDEQGNDLGSMHRADVIKLLDQRDLRLVRRNSSADPPEYQLLTGLQIHEERLRLREREKATPKAGPTQVKELTFSSNIGPHDLDTKSKQIQQWIEKKYQVQITIKKGKNVQEPENKMEELFNQILQTMPGMATFLARPHTIKGGRAAVCVLRCLSKKEENEYRRTQETQKGDVLSKESGPHGKSEVLQP